MTRRIPVTLAALAIAALLLQGAPAQAGGWGYHAHYHGPHYHAHYYGPHYYYHGYPGYVVRGLPPGCRVVRYGGAPYYYWGGVWYRPYGPGFVVAAPSVAIVLNGGGVPGPVVAAPIVRW